MEKHLVETVFPLSGSPTLTYVPPKELSRLLVGVRTPGRALVVEGPSGIGKSTAVKAVLVSLGVPWTLLSARSEQDLDLIQDLPSGKGHGTILIDDFHRLPDDLKIQISNYLKRLADESDPGTKLIVLGINRAGETLLRIAPDLLHRLGVVKMGKSDDSQVSALIRQGEQALNIKFENLDDLVALSAGSFNLAQLLSHTACIQHGILETQEKNQTVPVNVIDLLNSVMADLERAFVAPCIEFATGPRLRRSGRAPYLQISKWLAQSEEGSVNLSEAVRQHPMEKASVTQVVEKRLLDKHLSSSASVMSLLHYDPNTRVISAEDPKFLFYLRHLDWDRFSSRVGYINTSFDAEYDYALSFAGADRDIAEKLHASLSEEDINVFYDFAHQALLLAEDVEAYLDSVYSSKASYVVVLLSEAYSQRIWTAIEARRIKPRFDQSQVIPVLIDGYSVSHFDAANGIGGLSIDRTEGLLDEVERVSKVLVEKIADHRQKVRA